MPEDNKSTGLKIVNKTPITSDSAKMTAELAQNALANNNQLFANALLNELEDLVHDGEK
ncbi:MAG TPA: hypothetical protein VFF14_07870 [Candidatus Deferrimicrobium sp.]|nr:hypothetical protein [Candidatus Deferrimicrobium sp.]